MKWETNQQEKYISALSSAQISCLSRLNSCLWSILDRIFKFFYPLVNLFLFSKFSYWFDKKNEVWERLIRHKLSCLAVSETSNRSQDRIWTFCINEYFRERIPLLTVWIKIFSNDPYFIWNKLFLVWKKLQLNPDLVILISFNKIITSLTHSLKYPTEILWLIPLLPFF